MRRCVGMADEGDSKSLVLITRVGSTPTTGIKKKLPSSSGEFSFLSAACERVEQHGPALQGERSALRAVAQCAGDPHHRHKKGTPPACLGEFLFLSAACERVEQHGPDKECSGNVNHPHLPDRMVYRSGNGAVHFFVRQLLLFICCAPCTRRWFRSALFSPCKKAFLPAAFVARRSPGMAVRFAERSYSAREKAPEGCSGHLFRRFLPILQCFLQKRLYK